MKPLLTRRHIVIFMYSGTFVDHPPDKPAEFVVIDDTEVECEKCDQAPEWYRVVPRNYRNEGLESHSDYWHCRVEEPSIDECTA